MPSYWLKLYTEIIDDSKLAEVPEWAKWCFIEILCLAKENDKDGELQTVNKMAWRLRKTVKQVETALRTLEQIGVVRTTGAVWFVTNFAKRQALSESAERVRRFREKQKEEKNNLVTVTGYRNVSPSSSSLSLDSDSSDSSEVKDLPPAAVAYAAYQNNNGSPRQAEKLYQQVTGQMSIPSLSQTQALTDLQTLVDHYGKNIERAISEGKEIFGVWCNTAGKSGKPYSRTNTAWLGKWLEKIAPLPGDPHESSMQAILNKARKEQEAMQKR